MLTSYSENREEKEEPAAADRGSQGSRSLGVRRAGWVERWVLGAVRVVFAVVGWWQYPAEVAERRGHRRASGILVLTLFAVVCPLLWVVALVWASRGGGTRAG
jgi:hypothetical protein